MGPWSMAGMVSTWPGFALPIRRAARAAVVPRMVYVLRNSVPTSPAIANAIYNATGVRLTELPIRPDRLVAALKGSAAA